MSEIYMVTNKVNGKKYIGQGIMYDGSSKRGADARFKNHVRKSHGPEDKRYPLHRAMAKYGTDNFILEVLLQCNRQHADEYEIKAIASYNTMVPRGYNILPGGQIQLTPETREKISKAIRKSGFELPMYISEIKGGYCVKGNGVPFRAYTSSKLNMDEKLQKAKVYLQSSDRSIQTRQTASKVRAKGAAMLWVASTDQKGRQSNSYTLIQHWLF